MKTKKLVCYNCGGHGFITATYESGQTSAICPVCGGIGTHEIQMTNADRIRSMSDEELATMLKDYKDCSKNCIISNGKHCYQICEEESLLLKWLQQPAKEADYVV